MVRAHHVSALGLDAFMIQRKDPASKRSNHNVLPAKHESTR